MKKVIGVYSAPRQHWVGNGFPVRSLFSYQSHGKTLSPFLLLDRAGPDFPPLAQPPINRNLLKLEREQSQGHPIELFIAIAVRSSFGNEGVDPEQQFRSAQSGLWFIVHFSS